MKKLSEKNFVKKIQTVTEQIEKKLLPGSGETDCSFRWCPFVDLATLAPISPICYRW